MAVKFRGIHSNLREWYQNPASFSHSQIFNLPVEVSHSYAENPADVKGDLRVFSHDFAEFLFMEHQEPGVFRGLNGG